MIRLWLILGLIPLLLSGCGDATGPAGGRQDPPARVEKHPQEADIYRITLTPEAEDNLDLSFARVDRRSIPRYRTLGGEVVVPSGKSIVVTAPVTGTLREPDGGAVPRVGTRVDAGQKIFSLVPLLSPERDVPTPSERVQMANARASLVSSQITAAGDAKRSKAQVEAARIALGRAEQLLKDKAGSARSVDEARAALNIAEKTLEAAQERQQILDSLTLDAEKGMLRTLQITAPARGILRNLSAVHGQTVSATAPLFEVVDLETVWIRVPVYVGRVDEIDSGKDAEIGSLKGGPLPKSLPETTAKPIPAPPTADAISSSIDLYYEVANPGLALRPGQRVGVKIPLKGEAESLVVPWASVLYDIHGTTWVYEKLDEHVFGRRRVLVKYTVMHNDEHLAVLDRGPEPDTEIVVDGAAELFGTEFGVGK